MNLIDYFNTVYTIVISLSGFIAFVSLTIGGVMLLTSAGDPNKISEAKKRIYSALWGLLFILSSYFLLNTINPDLVNLKVPTLTDQSNSTYTSPPTKSYVPTILERVKEIANNTIISIDGLEDASTEIENLINNCDCARTQSLCICDGGGRGSSCVPIRAYADEANQPCPDIEKIEKLQKNIVAWKEELFYYKNRALAEEFDLSLAVTLLETERNYYQERVSSETDANVISFFNEKVLKLTEEINLRNALATELHNLARLISNLEPSVSELSELPGKCLERVEKFCTPSCETGGKYGCFDKLKGCVSGPVNGGNPCPLGEIEDRSSEIQSSRPLIESSCNSILNQVQNLINFKTLII